jgi:hypothetical protein
LSPGARAGDRAGPENCPGHGTYVPGFAAVPANRNPSRACAASIGGRVDEGLLIQPRQPQADESRARPYSADATPGGQIAWAHCTVELPRSSDPTPRGRSRCRDRPRAVSCAALPFVALWTERPWLALAASFTASRLIIALLGVVGVAAFVDRQTLTVVGAAGLNPEATWHKWDALWYERIAVHGYAWELDTLRGQAAAGFFPLFPLTVGLILTVVPGLSFFWVAVVFSNLLACGALALVAHRLTRNAEHTAHVMLAILTGAGSFYLSIPYAESLFLLLVVLVMIATRSRQYRIAGLLCGLAFTARAHGLALIAMPVIACALDTRVPARTRGLQALATLGLFAVPIAIYFWYLAALQGSALAFVDRQALWSNASPYPFRAFAGLLAFPRRVEGWLHFAFWMLYAGLLVRSWRRLPPGDALYCAGALVISTQQEIFQGTYRYVLPLIPLTLALADDRPVVRAALVAINLVFGTIMILAFVTNNRLAV